MKKWSDFLFEEPSKEHSKRVMDAVGPELDVNRAQNGRRFFNWRLVGGFGLLSIAAFGVFQTVFDGIGAFKRYSEKSAEQSEMAVAFTDLKEPGDFDLVSDLELMTDLESLEEWNGVDV
jgi:hypothetical protein